MGTKPASRLCRAEVISEAALPRAVDVIETGRTLARDWTVGGCAFLTEYGVSCEAQYKRERMQRGAFMQHAHVGLRDPETTRRACVEIYERSAAHDVRVDRYGLCLDWSMGYPRAERHRYPRGTGVILDRDEDFAALTAAAPVAPHFGDFVLGFPAAVENTRAALAAGATVIGNLGQYFNFRLRGWNDDVAVTRATLEALGLIAAQDVEVLVHSNLDDGFAAQFTDVSCVLGAALIEQHIVEHLVGAPLAHCFGHHYSDPVTRWAFQRTLARITATPGSMIFGNTVSYKHGASANFASLGGYLLVDLLGQQLTPSGHAVNPVPVSENERIPDADEIIDAQLYAGRLAGIAAGYLPLIDLAVVDECAELIFLNGCDFRDRVLHGLSEAGFDCDDAFELLLALRRLGAARLESLFGPGEPDSGAMRGRRAVLEAGHAKQIAGQARHALERVAPSDRRSLPAALKVLVATTDVHEHGKWLVEQVLAGLGVTVCDGGVSADPDSLVEQSLTERPDAIALSTYNGIALDFYQRLAAGLDGAKLPVPVLIGGRLNQIPEQTNTSLPVDVSAELSGAGARVCASIDDMVPQLLLAIGARRSSG